MRDRAGYYGYQEGDKIVVSPLTMVETIIHEAMHAAYPNWSERFVRTASRKLFLHMTDDECYRLWSAYAAKAKRIARPESGEDT